MGQAITVTEIDDAAVVTHMRETGMSRERAERTEAILTAGTQLVERQIRRYGIASGDALATKLEPVTFDLLCEV